MKKFEIRVPYSKTVYGWTTYLVEADSREEARKILLEESDQSDHYTQFLDAAEWEEMK